MDNFTIGDLVYYVNKNGKSYKGTISRISTAFIIPYYSIQIPFWGEINYISANHLIAVTDLSKELYE